MLDQVYVLPPTICVFYVIYVCSFVYDRVIAQQVPKIHKTFPIFIGGHAQDSILGYIDSCYKVVDVVMLNSDEPHIKNINNIHRR